MAGSVHALARRALPSSLFYSSRLLYRKARKTRLQTGYADRFPSRRDVKIHVIRPDVELHVFWKVLPIGRGPAFSLFVHDEEVLKFDCFGKGRGHFHACFEHGSSSAESRIHFFEPSAAQQIARVEFELLHNLDYYLQRHPWRRIRATQINPERLKTALSVATREAHMFLRSVPELDRLNSPENA